MSGFPTNQNSSAGAMPVWLAGAQSQNFAANNAGVQIKSGPGVFYGVVTCTVGVGSTVAAYDGTSAAGKKLGTFDTEVLGFTGMDMGLAFETGLFLVVAGGTPANVTAAYR